MSVTGVRLNCPSCGTRYTYEGDDRYGTCPACGRPNRVKR